MKEPGASQTAWIVAAATASLALDPALGRLVPPAAVQPTLACLRAPASGGGWKRRTIRWWGRPWCRRLIRRYESARLPGFSLHVAARKRLIEDACRDAIAHGFRQVVVLGAGYDTLALRLHREFPRVHCVEVDRAPTQRVKRSAALARELPSPTLDLVAADLSRQDLVEVLGACPAFRPGLDTVYIAEGLLMYLSESAVSGLVASVGAHGGGSAGRVRLVFTFMEPGPGGTAAFAGASPRVDRWLRRQGEPLRWGIRREAIGPWLAARGFDLLDLAGPQTFRQRVLAGIVAEDVPLPTGEFVCVAERRHGGRAAS